MDGGEYTIRYDIDKISIIAEGSPALLERVGDRYYLLEGFPPTDLKIEEDRWLPPTKKSYLELEAIEGDGVVIDCAGVAYKFKDIGDVTIIVGEQGAYLGQDKIEVTTVEPGLYDINLDVHPPYDVIRERKDKVSPDSGRTIARVRQRVRPNQLYARLGGKRVRRSEPTAVCRYGPRAYVTGVNRRKEYKEHNEWATRCLEEYGSYTNYELSQRVAYEGMYRVGSRFLKYIDCARTRVQEHGNMYYRDTPPPRGSVFRAWLYRCPDEKYIGGRMIDYYGQKWYLVYEVMKMTDQMYEAVFGRVAPDMTSGIHRRGEIIRENIWAMEPPTAEVEHPMMRQDQVIEWLSSWRGDSIYGWFYRDRRYRVDMLASSQ
jgi:hypothetical protein